jgi:dTDP-4-amino-4,6-dideoxygalactose transaminase
MRKKALTRREFLERTSAGLALASVAPRAAAVSGNPNALALNRGTPVRTRPYPDWPQTFALDEENILKSLRSHRWCTIDKGNFIPEFEQAWAKELGVGGCVMTPCGTHALHTAVEMVGVSPGDEVLVAAYTFIATISSITLNYALPVFVDTDVNTFTMDPDDIEHRITEHTRAILPVQMLGNAAHMDKILAIAKKHNLPVIEDACQAHTTTWRGKRLGTLGTVGCFSFQESKVLPGGEAGALVSDDQAIIERAYNFRNWGSDAKNPGHWAFRGTKYRISDFAASVLLAQMTRYKDICAIREENAVHLRQELKQIPGVYPQQQYPETEHCTCYHFGLRVDPEHFKGVSRDKVVEALNAEGIPVEGAYGPALNREASLEQTLNSRGYQRIYSKERLARYREQNHLPHNDQLTATAIEFEHNLLMGTRQDTNDIVEAFSKVQKNAAALA